MVVISDEHIILDDGTSIEVGKRYFFQSWGARFILIKSITKFTDECWIEYYEDVFLHKLTDDILINGRFEKIYDEYGNYGFNYEMLDTLKQSRISYNGIDFESFGFDGDGLTLLEEIPEQLFIDIINKKFKSILDYYTQIPEYIYISDLKRPIKTDDIRIISNGISDDNKQYIRSKKLEKLLASI
jgi:hypothetical protein